MKRNNLNRVFTSLLVCMLAVTAFIFKGCKDEEKDYITIYPRKGEKIDYIVSNVKGKLAYSEEEKKWVIHPDMDDSPFPSGDEMGSTLFVLNMKEEYKELEGEILFSGKATYLYWRQYGMASTRYYSLELTQISKRTVSRTIIDEDFKCATQAPTPPAWLFSRSTTNDDNNKYYNFRVFVHVVRNSAGTFPTDTNICYHKDTVSLNIITKLNEFYSGTNISFSLLGSDYINSNTYINMTDAQCNNLSNPAYGLLNVNNYSNALNIYVLSQAPNLIKTAGIAKNIPSNACMIYRHLHLQSTLPHEVGHCLGLYHTHHGTVNEVGGDNNQKPELVNGSNSSTAGDYITDTPADPCIWHEDICMYIGSETDKNGDYYNPDPSNIMNYASKQCRVNITQKQMERIHSYISHTAALQSICSVEDSITIEGPSYLGNGTSYTYSVDVPNNYIVTWKVTCKSCSSKTSSTTYSESFGNQKTITITNRYPSHLSQSYNIEATVTNNKGYTFYLHKTVYKISNPIQTGTLTWSSESPCGNYLGTINMSNPNNSTIKLHKGGILTFNYTDVCGANSYTDTDVFNFEIYNLNAIKEVGANHVFLIQPYATAPSNGKIMLSLMINGMGTMFQIPVEVLPCSQIGWNSLEDSTDIEISILEDSISFVTQ